MLKLFPRRFRKPVSRCNFLVLHGVLLLHALKEKGPDLPDLCITGINFGQKVSELEVDLGADGEILRCIVSG